MPLAVEMGGPSLQAYQDLILGKRRKRRPTELPFRHMSADDSSYSKTVSHVSGSRVNKCSFGSPKHCLILMIGLDR